VLAAIPYTTFPEIELGPLTLRTFGLMVGIGVLLGAWIAGRYIEARAGVPREESYRMATRLVIAGVVGARLTFVASHWEDVDTPIDVIAVWEGGLQFSGGFLGAILFGIPFFRRWDRRTRWVALDGYAYGLSLGLAIGRIGCYAVGEHFGRTSEFFLATRFDGGSVREDSLGDVPLVEGITFHQTALYEFGYLLVLFAVLGLLLRRKPSPAVLIGVFCAFYGVARFWSDSLRVNDERVAGLTGAQWMCAGLVVASAWILWKVVPSLRREGLGDGAGQLGDGAVDGLGGPELVVTEQVGHDAEDPLHEGSGLHADPGELPK
jgi:phosphatidylglycerol:prolipoprotein diacylglycerol transferase